jgi:hypothetical protein
MDLREAGCEDDGTGWVSRYWRSRTVGFNTNYTQLLIRESPVPPAHAHDVFKGVVSRFHPQATNPKVNARLLALVRPLQGNFSLHLHNRDNRNSHPADNAWRFTCT